MNEVVGTSHTINITAITNDDNGNQHKVYSIGTVPNPDLEFAVDVQGLRLKSKLKRRLAYLAGGICYD